MSRAGLLVTLGALALACASTSNPRYRTFHYQSKSEIKELSLGHWAGPFENRGVCLRNAGTKDEEVALFVGTGTVNTVWLSETSLRRCEGTFVATCRFPDGSSHTDEGTFTCRLGPDGTMKIEGSGKFTGGTGRFAGIQGTSRIVSSTRLTKPPEELAFDVVELEYTLPQK